MATYEFDRSVFEDYYDDAIDELGNTYYDSIYRALDVEDPFLLDSLDNRMYAAME